MKTSSVFNRSVLSALALGAAGFTLPATARAAHVDVGLSVGVAVPHGYARVNVGRDHYYYNRGVFYRPGPHGYYVVRAPRGAIIRTLPPHYARVYIGSSVYYRYGDIYYRDYDGGYIVVDNPAPTTTIVTSAATPPPAAPKEDDYQTVFVGDTEYQFKDGQFFKKNADGLVWTPAPMGAVTSSLPSDARSVWYQDVEYFECEDVYFRKTQEGYRVVDAPWKKDGAKK